MAHYISISRSRRLAAAVLPALLLWGGLSAPPAQAQFVCADTVTSGQDADATGSANNFACGPNADASGLNSANTATGAGADASGGASGNIATGRVANASGNASSNTATGNLANASGNASSNIATGRQANASGDDSTNIATGADANASGDFSTNTATGNFANASGVGSTNIATGAGANASGNDSSNIAIGQEANAAGDGVSNTAVGASSNATGANASAFGSSASATHANSAAFGTGATTSRDNQQVFGTASNTYTMSGIASAESRTAQGAPTHIVTSNAGGDLAAFTAAELGLATAGDLSVINSRLREIGGMSSKALTGVAMAFAMAGTPTLLPHENFALSLNYGIFESRNGVAINSAFRLHDNVQFNAAVGYGINDNLVGGRAGLRFGW